MLPTVIIIVTLVFVAIFLLFRLEFRLGNWIQMVHVDEDGNTIGSGKPFRVPTPDRVARNGLSRVDEYLARLVGSPANYCYLLIFTPNGKRGMSLCRREGNTSLGLMVEWRKEHNREIAIRSFFADRGIEPTEDYLAGNGNVPDATRILEYPVSADAGAVAELCRQVLVELCAVTETEGLDFTFQER